MNTEKRKCLNSKKQTCYLPKLREAFPEIRTYVGRSQERPNINIRLSYTPTGINAWIRYPSGESWFLQPLVGQKNRYLSYKRSDQSAPDGFNCSTSLKDNWKDLNLPSTYKKVLEK